MLRRHVIFPQRELQAQGSAATCQYEATRSRSLASLIRGPSRGVDGSGGAAVGYRGLAAKTNVSSARTGSSTSADQSI
jgi:hypothetical protein